MEPKGLIIAFTTARHFSLSRARALQSTSPRPISISILPSQQRLGFSDISLLQVSRTSAPPLLSSIRVTCPAHLILLDLITWIIIGGDYGTRTASLLRFLLTTLFSNILSLPSLFVRSQVSWPHKTKATLQFYTSLLFFSTEKGKKIQHWTAAGIPWVKPKKHIHV